MIDTVKIHLLKEFHPAVYAYCLNNSNQMQHGFLEISRSGTAVQSPKLVFKSIDYEENNVAIVNGNYYVKSSAYKVHWRVHDDYISLEFSIPKYLYGQNLSQLVRHSSPAVPFDYTLFRKSIEYCLREMFPLISHFHGVIITRIDFCFNQIYATERQTRLAIEYYARSVPKATHSKTGFYRVTKSNYFKVYHKGDEFNKNRGEYARKVGQSSVETALEISSRILRFEDQRVPKNWSYSYLKWKYPSRHRQYRSMKRRNDRSIDYQIMHKKFSRRYSFSLTDMGDTVKGVVYLDPRFFNILCQSFLDSIKSKFTIPVHTISALQSIVMDVNISPKNKIADLRIINLIKQYGSLDSAVDNKAVSLRTSQRYKKRMKDRNIQTVNKEFKISQDWTFRAYYRHVAPFVVRLDTPQIRFSF